MAKLFYNKDNVVSLEHHTEQASPALVMSLEELDEQMHYCLAQEAINTLELDKATHDLEVSYEELIDASTARTTNVLKVINHTSFSVAKRLGISTESLSTEGLENAKLSTEGLIQGIINGITFIIKKIGEFIANIWRAIMEFLGLSEKRTESIIKDTEDTKKLIKEVLKDTKEDENKGPVYTMKIKKHKKKDLKIIKSQQEEINKLKKEVSESKKPVTIAVIRDTVNTVAAAASNESTKLKVEELKSKYGDLLSISGSTLTDLSWDVGNNDDTHSNFIASMKSALYMLRLCGLNPDSLFTHTGAFSAASKFDTYLKGIAEAVEGVAKIGKEILDIDSSKFDYATGMDIYSSKSNDLSKAYKDGLEFILSDVFDYTNPSVKTAFKDRYGWCLAALVLYGDVFKYDGYNTYGTLYLYNSDPRKSPLSSDINVSSNFKMSNALNIEFKIKQGDIGKIVNEYKKLKKRIDFSYDKIKSACSKLTPNPNETNEAKIEYIKNLSKILKTFNGVANIVQKGIINITKVTNKFAELENEYVNLIAAAE